jgi:hypothetical protein
MISGSRDGCTGGTPETGIRPAPNVIGAVLPLFLVVTYAPAGPPITVTLPLPEPRSSRSRC